MRIVKMKGGLGNQMFQYVFAKNIAILTKDEVKLDFTFYNHQKDNKIYIPKLKKFNISFEDASQNEIDSMCIFRHDENSGILKRLSLLAENTVNKRYYLELNRAYIDPTLLLKYDYFNGYWQSWRYVKSVENLIKQEFVPNYILRDAIRADIDKFRIENAVFVGIRKGDYLQNIKHYGNLGTDYYRKAMKQISNYVINAVYYIFSNDISWCKKNLNLNGFNVVLREPKYQMDDFEELILMSNCKHAIIANSSFHWWGATLITNPNKIVCCPEKWWFDNKPIDIIPDEWIRISL